MVKRLVSMTIGASAVVLVWLVVVHLQARAEGEGISVEGCVRTIAMQDQECV